MEVPEIRFAKSGDVNIGYQHFGMGPDVVVIPPLVSNVEIMWENELWRRVLEFQARHVRTLTFDKRGIGISDRIEQHPTLVQRISDIHAVMEAEGVKRASLVGLSEGGLMAQLFAAIHPERVERLVLINSLPGASAWSQLDRYGDVSLHWHDELHSRLGQLVETWGRDPRFLAEWFMPSQCENPYFLRWLARYQRQAASPADLRRQIHSLAGLDAAEYLSTIRTPTLVMQARSDRVIPAAAGRYLAEKIPDATYVEFAGDDHFCWVMASWRSFMDRWVEFVAGVTPTAHSERRFATVLFTDIVASTERTIAIGDEAWRGLLESHDRIAWRSIDRYQGRLVKHMGDGLLAIFESPSRAVACASTLCHELAAIGVEIRGGLHAGEVTVRDDGDVTGQAVNLASRIQGAASAGSIYVSSTVREILLGGERSFEDRGEHTLKGIEGVWRLYEMVR